MNIPALISLAFLICPNAAWSLGPEWEYIKSAEKFMEQERYPEAKNEIQWAYELNPEEPKIWEDAAIIYEKTGRPDVAVRNFKKAISISEEKSLDFAKGTRSRRLWENYIAELRKKLARVSGVTVKAGGNGFVCGVSTVADVEGNIYGTVKIGNQCWMGENMRTTKYPGGGSITKGPSAHKAKSWNTDQGYYYSCPPNAGNDGKDCAAAGGTEKLGMLYQWSAAVNGGTSGSGAQGICPNGWHVPTDAQYKTLEMALGMSKAQADATGWRGTAEGDALKKSGLCEGGKPCGASGFDVLFAGYRSAHGEYDDRGEAAGLWSSTPAGGRAWVRYLHASHAKLSRGKNKNAYGLNVRCIKD